jgi:hypothetical protein
MLRKLTINVADDVHDALHRIVGQGNISRFIEDLVRPQLVRFERVSAEAGRGCVGYRGKPATEQDIKLAAKKSAGDRWARKARRSALKPSRST